MSCFDILEFLHDTEPRSAPVNMAMDEVILEETSVPTLRVYRWLRPAVSFGYFEKYSTVKNQHPDRELVRRWTGGGVVLHGEDFTYSLIIPRGCGLDQMRSAQSYAAIHEILAQTLRESGMTALVAAGASPKTSTACFENAVAHDVLVDDRKIAGAAQRRSRRGLLHQGSVQGMELPGDFADSFSGKLAANVTHRPVRPGELSAAHALAESKYATERWMRKF